MNILNKYTITINFSLFTLTLSFTFISLSLTVYFFFIYNFSLQHSMPGFWFLLMGSSTEIDNEKITTRFVVIIKVASVPLILLVSLHEVLPVLHLFFDFASLLSLLLVLDFPMHLIQHLSILLCTSLCCLKKYIYTN